MPLLNEHTLPIIRHHLSLTLPTVKSAHLAEALAASLGYATNAALRADLKLPDGSPNLHKTVRVDRLLQRLESLGYNTSIWTERDIYSSFYGSGYNVLSFPMLVASEDRNEPTYADMELLSTGEQIRGLVYGMWKAIRQSSFQVYLREDCDPAGRAYHLVLAECFRIKRALDPIASDFLITALMEAAAEDEISPLSWTNHIFEAFRARMFNFMNEVCQTWQPDIVPLDLRYAADLPKQHGLWMVAAGASLERNVLTPRSTENPSLDMPDTIGLFAMASFLSGASVAQQEERLHEIYISHDPIGTCMNLVPTIGSKQAFEALYLADENPMPFSAAKYAWWKMQVVESVRRLFLERRSQL